MEASKVKFVSQYLLTAALCLMVAPFTFAGENRWLYKAEIVTNPSNPMQKLDLPESFQNVINHKDLHRIKVVDHKGNVIPSIVKGDHSKQVPAVEHPLGIFPVYGDLKAPLDMASMKFSYDQGKIEVNVGPDSAMINEPTMATQFAAAKKPTAYVLENPQYDADNHPNNFNGELKTITLEWNEDFEGLAALQVYTSSNLNQWHTVVIKDNVANMSFMGQKLYKNRISIPKPVGRYLRINWIAHDKSQPKIHKVTGSWTQPDESPPYAWSENLNLTKVESTPETEVPKNTYDFTVSPSFMADRFRLVTRGTNQMFSGTLMGHGNSMGQTPANSRWNTLSDFKFYRVISENGEISLMDQAIAPNNYYHWRIHFDYPAEINLEEVGLQVSRYPLKLYFLMQEGQSYYLIYDSSGVNSDELNLSSIVSSVLDQGDNEAAIASLIHPQFLTPDVEAQSLNWKKILLWLVLIGGVIMMLGMARRLAKDLATHPDSF